ncbi:MAG: DUF4974 domain-containing protein [Muribaculaceae bacterium]|nr:DUF4974 domain-containing protein [Muribaculaceae bacterium]
MEQNDNINRLLDMHEHPENYADEQLATMLDDEMQEQLATAKRAMTDIPEPDVDAEWQRFEREHFAPVKNRRWLKVAAMFIGVLMLSAFTYAAIQAVRNNPIDKAEETAQSIVTTTQAESAVGPRLGVADTVEEVVAPVVYDNQPLEQMLDNIASRYGKSVEFRNEEARDLRFYFELHPGEDLNSVVERLNMFDRVSVSIEGNTIVVE